MWGQKMPHIAEPVYSYIGQEQIYCATGSSRSSMSIDVAIAMRG
jgi:hypothetical protein